MSENRLIKWDPKAHDNKLIDRQKEEAMALVGRRYERWKMAARKLTTRPAHVKALQLLRREISQICRSVGLHRGDWFKITIGMIDQKIAAMKGNGPVAINCITFPGDPPVVKYFSSMEELQAMPEVAEHLARPELIGLVREGPKIFAFYKDTELILIGGVVNPVGIEHLPTLKEIRDEMNGQG